MRYGWRLDVPGARSIVLHPLEKQTCAMAKILIVDDSPAFRASIRSIVEALGHTTILAENGEQAISIATSRQPDAILMDVVMPQMNGYQATRHISKAKETAHIPVVLVTSRGQETDKVWGFRQGARAYVSKPFSEAELKQALDSVLAPVAGQQPPAAGHVPRSIK